MTRNQLSVILFLATAVWVVFGIPALAIFGVI